MSGPSHTHDDTPPHDHGPNEGGGHSHLANSHHGHTHGAVDPSITTTQRGIWAIKWSFVGLLITAALQMIVVVLTGSVALLADTIHNLGDALTAVPLWIAFMFARRKPGRRFTYGFGRVEDLAGVIIVLVILASAVIAGYLSIGRLLNPRDIEYVWVVAAAGAIGFLGNEAVALFRIKVGKEIKSAALIADGYHARVDGLTSLGVTAGAVAVAFGFPLADPIVGLIITALIVRIVWDSAKEVFTRLLDGVDPAVVEEIKHVASHAPGVQQVTQLRARWLGHRLHAELNVSVGLELSVVAGHEIAKELRHRLLHEIGYLSNVMVHIDPMDASGEEQHRIAEHRHNGFPAHSHH